MLDRKKTIVAVLTAVMACLGCWGGSFFEINDQNGVFEAQIGGLPVLYSNSLGLCGSETVISPMMRWQDGVLVTSLPESSYRIWNADGSALIRKLTPTADGAQLSFDFFFAKGLAGKTIELSMGIPTAAMDWPADTIPHGEFNRPLTLQTLNGKLIFDPSGSVGGEWGLDDFRTISWCRMFRLRFFARYDQEHGTHAKAVLTIKAVPEASPALCPIPLDQVANRTFADNAARTGWTGQGADNDLGTLTLKEIYCAGIPFRLIGHAVILKGRHTPSFPDTTGVVNLPRPMQCSAIYFLHTAAWDSPLNTAVARYNFHYQDGSNAAVPVYYGPQIVDWWAAQAPYDARLGWQGILKNGHPIGVYVMRAINPNPEKTVTGIEFVSENQNSTPILLAATAVNSKVATQVQQKELDRIFSQKDGPVLNTKQWLPCAIDWCGKIEPGSALDFSFLNRQPAGEFGFLKRAGSEFEFVDCPGQPVRFWGTNFAIYGPFPDKTLSTGIARTLAAQGVNLVRIHLYAARPTQLQSPDGGLNPDMLDKMFFLISELKKNGIYIYMDLNDGMCYDQLLQRPSTAIPEEYLKFASLFDPQLKEATKRLAKLVFTTVNPYTGKALADDPVVAMYELMNEISMFANFTGYLDDHPAYRPVLEKLWNQWREHNHFAPAALPSSFNLEPVGRKFALEMEDGYLREMSGYLRSIGVKAPICGTNITFSNGDLVASAQLDFLGDHDYWAHPQFWGGKPTSYPVAAALSRPVWTKTVGALGGCALWGAPVVHSEWNYCFPNPYRSEGVPTAAAYAAYQGWDGMIFYGATGSCDDGVWSRFLSNPGIMVHAQQTDPATWGLSQVGAAILRRGDVEPAKRDLQVIQLKSDVADNVVAFEKMPFLLALGRFGISFADKANWLGKLAESDQSPEKLYFEVLKQLGDKESNANRVVSDTRQIRRYCVPPLLLIDTPRTQSITGRLSEIPQSGDSLSDLKVVSTMNWGSLNAVSIDGKPLKSSDHILLVAVGNAANTGEKLEGEYILDLGKAPVLVEPFQADVALNCSAAGTKVFVLNPQTGARMAELKSSFKDNTLSFQLNGEKSIYYEIFNPQQINRENGK